MYQKLGSYEAKTKLPEILRRVEAGESFTITNRGTPIADITPTKEAGRAKVAAAIVNILKAKKHTVSYADLMELKEGARK